MKSHKRVYGVHVERLQERDMWKKTEDHEYLVSCMCGSLFLYAVLMTQEICDFNLFTFSFFKEYLKFK